MRKISTYDTAPSIDEIIEGQARLVEIRGKFYKLNILNKDVFRPSSKFIETINLIDDIRAEVGVNFGDESISGFEIISNNWKTFLVNSAESSQLVAWGSIHKSEDDFFDGFCSRITSIDFRRKGLATFLAKEMIKYCWDSLEVNSSQFKIKRHNIAAQQALHKACSQINLDWKKIMSNVQIVDGLDLYRIPLQS